MEGKIGRLDPWGSELVEDYQAIMDEFGIKKFKPLLSTIKNAHRYMKRGIIFGHRDFDLYLEATKSKPFALLTGFMPTGPLHFGSKMVADEIVWFQQMGAEVFVLIADIESYTVRGISMEQGKKNAMDMIKSLIALGLKPEKCHIYFQSNYKPTYYKLQNMFSKRITLNGFKALYGDEVTPGKIISALLQAADILHPQLEEFGGFKHVVVPVGIDQDVHMRVTRDIAGKSEFGFRPPSSIYHKFMTGLDGGKMSKSRPDSVISLTDDVAGAVKKLRKALDGGRETAAQQKELGGEPDKCMVFEMLKYHLVASDKKLLEWKKECESGGLLCGDCKAKSCKLLTDFLEDHQKKMKKADLKAFGV